MRLIKHWPWKDPLADKGACMAEVEAGLRLWLAELEAALEAAQAAAHDYAAERAELLAQQWRTQNQVSRLALRPSFTLPVLCYDLGGFYVLAAML